MVHRTRAPRRFRAPRVDHFRVVRDVTVRGATEKDILENPKSGVRYVAKLGGRFNDLEVMTEYAIFLIGRSLGVQVADAKIASFRGRLRFLSRYFLDRSNSEELVHGVQLFNALYDDATVNAVLGNEASEQAFFTVQAVQDAFEAHYLEYGPQVHRDLCRGFVRMLAHDALIGVQDRHHENWGLIVQRGRGGPPPRFAPLYDSARGLFGNATDGHIGQYFGPNGGMLIDRYVERSRPLIGFAGLEPSRGRTHLSHHQLLAAIFERHEETRPWIRSVVEAFDFDGVRRKLKRLEPLCSARRRTLMLECLRQRHRRLLAVIDRLS